MWLLRKPPSPPLPWAWGSFQVRLPQPVWTRGQAPVYPAPGTSAPGSQAHCSGGLGGRGRGGWEDGETGELSLGWTPGHRGAESVPVPAPGIPRALAAALSPAEGRSPVPPSGGPWPPTRVRRRTRDPAGAQPGRRAPNSGGKEAGRSGPGDPDPDRASWGGGAPVGDQSPGRAPPPATAECPRCLPASRLRKALTPAAAPLPAAPPLSAPI
jgi:hypothetical protein